MRTSIQRLVILQVATAFLTVVALGRRTAHAFGEDMQNAGESIESGSQ